MFFGLFASKTVYVSSLGNALAAFGHSDTAIELQVLRDAVGAAERLAKAIGAVGHHTPTDAEAVALDRLESILGTLLCALEPPSERVILAMSTAESEDDATRKVRRSFAWTAAGHIRSLCQVHHDLITLANASNAKKALEEFERHFGLI